MHIGLIIYGSLDTVSGGYLYDRHLVAHLRDSGHTVEVISLPARDYGRHLTDNLSHTLLARLQNASFDILLQDELNHPSLFKLNGRLRQTASYPIISIVHHLRTSEQHASWQRSLYEAVEEAYLASVDGFIFNSETTRRSVEAIVGQKRPFVVAPPSGKRFQPEMNAKMIAAQAKKEGPYRILFVGNVIRRKGLHTLLDAVRQLPIGSYRLDVVGDMKVDPKYADNCMIIKPVNGEIVVHGAVSDARLEALFGECQVLAVPSQYEGFGIVYLEGMAFGLPAIGTTAGGAQEVIEDGRNGFLVPPNHPTTLAQRLAQLQRDRALLAKMGTAAWHTNRVSPSWKESMARVVDFLETFFQGEGVTNGQTIDS